MKIIYLELSGYIRLGVAEIKKFVYRPNQRIQLILGTNGSGKSSIIEELSPLPALHSNYEKTGYKIVELTHRGKHYRIESRFSPSQRHTFSCDGEEIVASSAPSVIRDYVRDVFGLTPEIHELLTGVEKFVGMGPARRREWFTKLSEANYDYAIKIYTKVKDEHKSTLGALKRAKESITIESAKLVGVEELKSLEAELSELNDLSAVLISNYHRTESQPRELQTAVNDQIAELSDLARRLGRVKQTRPSFARTLDIAALPDEIVETQRQLTIHEAEISERVAQYDKVNKLLKELEQAQSEGSENTSNAIEALIAERETLRATLVTELVFEDPIEAQNSLLSISDYFMTEVASMEADERDEYNQQNLETQQQALYKLNEAQRQAHQSASILKADIKHMESLRDGTHANCPRCQFSWAPGFDESKYYKKVTELTRLTDVYNTLTQDIDKKTAYIDAIRRRLSMYYQIQEQMGHHPHLRALWIYIRSTRMISKNPSRVADFIGEASRDIATQIKIQKVEQSIARQTALAEELRARNIGSREDLAKFVADLENMIDMGTGEINRARARLTALKDLQERYTLYRGLQARYEAGVQNLDIKTEELIEAIRQQAVSEALADVQHRIHTKSRRLNEMNNQQEVVDFIKKEIEALTLRADSTTLLMKSLSPVDGLIAEGMIGFIKKFIGQMNRLIRRIWTYRLEILPCGLSSDGSVDLDYKFPMIALHQSNKVPEISKGSEAMQEIVNLAFRLTAMQYLDMDDSFISLDEFARAFDYQHKRSSVDLINAIMTEKNFSQLFMVSHDYAQYSALCNYDAIVVSEKNIILPERYNECVEIT